MSMLELSTQPSKPRPRPIFIYGTLRALPLLAWVLTGDASKVRDISRLVQPARIYGYARFSVKNCDYPAVIKHEPQSSVDGYLLTVETTCQRKKLDDFEGETYKLASVAVNVFDENSPKHTRIVEADIYLWAGDENALTASSWELKRFEEERLEDWLDIFAGIEFIGDAEESTTTS
ncbi:AIG2-like protein [Hypoxylon argillaceum]|nr:AIG2-like protein [Hypoxylon argillaceum]